ncbi:MAG: hypothetical protein Q8K96_05080 [Rubrivivax sp.]|nr:hypothetical protein [Rubrivivax sp.]
MTRQTKWVAWLATMVLAAAVHAAPVSGQGTWETTLQARDLNGDSVTDAFYDTALNITWLRNANVNGLMNWPTANAWANGLSFGGYTDWRLPTMVDTGAPGCNWTLAGGTDCGYNVQTATSEMAHLFYVSLGNKAFCAPGDAVCAVAQAGFGLTNTGDFESLVEAFYWSGLEYALNPSDAWYFLNTRGIQHFDAQNTSLFFALAVRPGDVVAAAVPEPQAVALALTALGALALVRRRRPR